MEKIKTNYILLFFTFIYLNYVTFKFSIMGSYLVIYGIPIFFLLTNFVQSRIIISKRMLHVMYLLFIMVAMSFLWPIVFGTYDFGYLYVIFNMLKRYIIFLFVFLMIKKIYGVNMTVEHFMYYYAMSTVLYVIVTVVFTIIPDIKCFWFNLIYIAPNNLRLMNSYGYNMRIGFSGFSGYRKTIMCTLSILFLTHIQWSTGSRFRINKKNYVGMVFLCLLGNMFYGRIGVAISVVALCFALVLYKKITIHNCFVICCIMSVFVGLYKVGKGMLIFKDWISWLTIPFINLFVMGDFNNGSVNTLNQMLFLPNWKIILFGMGIMANDYSSGNYLLGNDSGVMRNIIYWGIGGTVVAYALLYNSLKIVKWKDYVFEFLLLCCILVFEIKGDMYYEIVALSLACSTMIRKKHDKEYEEKI